MLLLLWLILPQFSGALLLHSKFLDQGYNLIYANVLSKAPPMYQHCAIPRVKGLMGIQDPESQSPPESKSESKTASTESTKPA